MASSARACADSRHSHTPHAIMNSESLHVTGRGSPSLAEVTDGLLEIWCVLADRLLMSQNYKRSSTTPNNKE